MRSHGPAVGKELAEVVEEHHAVAEEAPALLRVAGHDVGGVAVGRVRGRTRWVMGAHDRLLRWGCRVGRPYGHGHIIY